MVSKSFDQWANDLAASIAAKNPQPSTEVPVTVSSNKTEHELYQSFLTLYPIDNPKLYDDRRKFIAKLIGETFVWVESPEGMEFWQEIYQKIQKI